MARRAKSTSSRSLDRCTTLMCWRPWRGVNHSALHQPLVSGDGGAGSCYLCLQAHRRDQGHFAGSPFLRSSSEPYRAWRQTSHRRPRILANHDGGDSAQNHIAYEVSRAGGEGPKQWSEEALLFEATLLRINDMLETYIDAPRGQLLSIFRGAGGAFGRRALVLLLEEQIGLLSTLKQTP